MFPIFYCIGSISVLKIPQAHVALQQAQSVSGSEGPLIPSDYPSESHSENEEVDTGSLPVSSHGSYENSAFIQDASSIYSENYGHTQEIRTVAACESSPKFDIHVRVKRTPPPLPSPLTSDSDSSTSINRIERNNLSTILESHEDARSDSILTLESLQEAGQTQFTYTPELHSAPKHIKLPPALSQISITSQQQVIHQFISNSLTNPIGTLFLTHIHRYNVMLGQKTMRMDHKHHPVVALFH